MKFITQTRKTDKLNGTMAAAATSATLLAGEFGAPAGRQIITIDYDVAAKAADFICTLNNTAVTSMTRLNGPDVEHATGANVAMCAVDEHFNLTFDALNDGWVDTYETWAYASATTITVPAGAASRFAVGDKIKLTQTTVKYFYVTGVADTVLTVTGGTDYTVANAAITSPYYSHANPVGFPDWFNYTPTSYATGGGATWASVSAVISKFKVEGRQVTWILKLLGTLSAADATYLTIVGVPINRAGSGAGVCLGSGKAMDNNGPSSGFISWDGTNQAQIIVYKYNQATWGQNVNSGVDAVLIYEI